LVQALRQAAGAAGGPSIVERRVSTGLAALCPTLIPARRAALLGNFDTIMERPAADFPDATAPAGATILPPDPSTATEGSR
jgi:hypothetical protein